MKLTRKRLGLAIVLAQSVGAVSMAQAQLEEIIVTAERREASLQETDISITVLDERTLKEMGSSMLFEMGDFAPNVKMHEMPGKAGAAISMRGFHNAETIGTFEPKVALYLDGVLIAKNAGAAFDILDLERIEMLRGPQGTLYGRNTVGGAVNLITRKPTDEFEGNLSATLGKYNQRDLKGTINVPLVGANGVLSNSTDQSLNLRATLGSLQRDGFFQNDFLDIDLADRDRLVGHLQLEWKPSDNLSFLYAYDRSDIDETAWPLQLIDYNRVTRPNLAPYVGDGSSRDRPQDVDGYMEAEVDGHSLTVNWDLNDDLSLVSITALRNMENIALTDSDSTPVFVFHNFAGDEIETFTQEIRLVGSAADSRLNYVVGGFYMDEDIKEVFTVNQLPGFVSNGVYLPFPLDSGTYASGVNEVWAVFGEATYALTEQLDLTAGLRYTEEDREMSRFDTTVIPAFGTNTVNPLPDASGDFDDISGMLSLSYQWTNDFMTYAKVSKGYVSGGFNPRSPSPELFSIGYEEETVWNYELGWKATLLDGAMILNGAYFYNDYEDLQVNVLTDTGRNNIGNAGKATIKGFEIEVQARPTDRLDLGGGYGYLDPEYDTYIDPLSGADLSNNHWAHASTHTLNAWTRYTIPDFQSIGDLSFRVDWSYRSKFSLLTVPGNEVSSYDFVNARVALDGMQGPGGTTLNLAFWGKNLTDELWYTSGYNLVSNLGFRAQATSPPRTFGVTLDLDF